MKKYELLYGPHGHLGFTVGYQIRWQGFFLDTFTCPNG